MRSYLHFTHMKNTWHLENTFLNYLFHSDIHKCNPAYSIPTALKLQPLIPSLLITVFLINTDFTIQYSLRLYALRRSYLCLYLLE